MVNSLSIPDAASAISSDSISEIACVPSSNVSPPTCKPYALTNSLAACWSVGRVSASDSVSAITRFASACTGIAAIFPPTTSTRPPKNPPAIAAGMAISSDTPFSFNVL